MCWLFTVGCGFIDSALVENLRMSESNKLRVIGNLSVGAVGAGNGSEEDVEFVLGDI